MNYVEKEEILKIRCLIIKGEINLIIIPGTAFLMDIDHDATLNQYRLKESR
jgi:hypothetical protein